MKKLLSKVIILVTLFSVLATGNVNASGASAFLDMPIIEQSPYSNGCWAAAGTSVCRYKGNSVSSVTYFANQARSFYLRSADFSSYH